MKPIKKLVQNMNLLDNVLKYSTLASVFILFLSYLSQSMFYKQFNIDIISYISLSEFMVLFLKDSILIIIVVSSTFPFVKFIKHIQSKNNNFFNLSKFKNWFIIILSLLSSTLIISIIISKISNTDFSHAIIPVAFLSFVILITSIALGVILKENVTQKMQLIIGVMFSVILISSFSVLKSYQIKNYPSNLFHEIKLLNSTIKTDHNLIKIGQTENYFFLYNKSNKTTSIIKIDNLLEVNITNK